MKPGAPQKPPPTLASDDEPEPARVTDARARKPLKRTVTAVKEREKKRDYRERARMEEARKELQVEAAEEDWTPLSTEEFLKLVLNVTAQVTNRPVLVPPDRDMAKCARALAPVMRKYMPKVLGDWKDELHAAMVLGAILGPRVLAAASGARELAGDESGKVLDLMKTEGGGAAATS